MAFDLSVLGAKSIRTDPHVVKCASTKVSRWVREKQCFWRGARRRGGGWGGGGVGDEDDYYHSVKKLYEVASIRQSGISEPVRSPQGTWKNFMRNPYKTGPREVNSI